jgi:AcrB/AcrD/AcrF family
VARRLAALGVKAGLVARDTTKLAALAAEMGIVRFALKFPYTFYVLTALILFLGVSAIIVMPEDIFPEINIPVVSVIWQYTGLSTPEME